MLVLDTNLVSELMRPAPDPRVLGWAAAQPLQEMAIATVTLMEIRYGIAVLPRGRRRSELDGRFRRFLAQGFSDRILPFDAAAAEACADIRAARKDMGRPLAAEDGMIAAIAKVQGAAVVTRDVGGFDGCGIVLVNPWEA
jgi:predicted nucleic acid-binding protein